MLNPEYCRAKLAEERANETSDFIMKELGLAQNGMGLQRVEGPESFEAIDCLCRKGAARLSAPAQERHAPGAHPGGELGGGVLSGAAGRHAPKIGRRVRGVESSSTLHQPMACLLVLGAPQAEPAPDAPPAPVPSRLRRTWRWLRTPAA